MNNIKYGLIGTGRLGSEVETILNENGYSIVLKEDINGTWQIGEPQLIIDCSLPEAFSKTIEHVKSFEVPLIMATTGLTNEHLKMLHAVSRIVPVIQSFNYSIGIQLLLKLTEIAKNTLPGWDVEITETHHRFKKDKPSGTAKMIQNVFDGKEIEVSSLRLGNVAGDHTVYFGGLGEVISIKHSATSRRTFAEGILKSADFILNKKPGLYTFTDVVFNPTKEG
jgi:4-hydroxy-tetrahydrodipicolinate reductase